MGTLGQGGAERQLYYMVRLLVDEGVRVRVFTLEASEYWEAPLTALGVDVVSFGQRHGRLTRLAKLLNLVGRDLPEIIHSQHFYTNLYATLVARTLRIQEVGSVRNRVACSLLNVGHVMGRLSLKLPRTLVCNSAKAVGDAKVLRGAKSVTELLPNMVDLETFCLRSDNSKGSTFRLLGVGRLVPEKRFDRFLEVVARIVKRCPDPIRAGIVGDGPLRSQLESRALELGLGSEVLSFHGNLSNIVPLLHQSDCLLLTSATEGTPNVILEAMSCGLPVVATDVGGVSAILIDHETGFLAVGDDIDGMADRVLELYHDQSKRAAFGARGRVVVEERFSEALFKRKLYELYSSCLA